jgi:hypothetical protein
VLQLVLIDPSNGPSATAGYVHPLVVQTSAVQGLSSVQPAGHVLTTVTETGAEVPPPGAELETVIDVLWRIAAGTVAESDEDGKYVVAIGAPPKLTCEPETKPVPEIDTTTSPPIAGMGFGETAAISGRGWTIAEPSAARTTLSTKNVVGAAASVMTESFKPIGTPRSVLKFTITESRHTSRTVALQIEVEANTACDVELMTWMSIVSRQSVPVSSLITRKRNWTNAVVASLGIAKFWRSTPDALSRPPSRAYQVPELGGAEGSEVIAAAPLVTQAAAPSSKPPFAMRVGGVVPAVKLPVDMLVVAHELEARTRQW